MKQLSTIQKREKLNDVFAVDEIGPGGANHLYCVYKAGTATLEDDDTSLRAEPENLLLTLQMAHTNRRHCVWILLFGQ